MDNPTSESSSISTSEASSMFSSLLGGEPIEKDAADTPEAAAERLAADDLSQEAPAANDEAPAPSEKLTIEVDGKSVELTKAEIAEHYKNGLRQADYTRKTMEVADARKSADAEAAAAKQERQDYAQKLGNYAIQLQGALHEQSQIDWQQLLESDPVEYLKQERTFKERQAALQQAQQEQSGIHKQMQSEQAEADSAYRSTQQQELLAKLPEWKDPEKAKAESSAIKEYLTKQGMSAQKIDSINDAAEVVLHRKAMLYDALIARASSASKKVAALPVKVERPGVQVQASDGRGDAMKRLAKSGSINDAASIFSRML